MACLPLQVILAVAMVATVRCQGDCYLGEEATVENARSYIRCLREQLNTLEDEIVSGEEAIQNSAADDGLIAEYELLDGQRSSQPGDEAEVTSYGDGRPAVTYDNVDEFPECRGLTPDQCRSLLIFLEETIEALRIRDDAGGRPLGAPDARRKRAAGIGRPRMPLLKSAKLRHLDPATLKNIRTLILWQIQNGGYPASNSPKFKGRWGRSVGHVTGAGQSAAAVEWAGRGRDRRSAMKALLMSKNINSISPKVRQMLADFLLWKAKNPGYIKLTSRHG